MQDKHSKFMWVAGATALGGILTVAAAGGLSARGQQQGSARSKGPEGKSMTEQTGFYCNLKAFTPEEREHHRRVSEKLAEGRVETRELADGFAFRLRTETVTLADLADWVSNERKCCPFFDFEIVQEREGGALWLKLRGAEGVKRFIRSEFKLQPLDRENGHE